MQTMLVTTQWPLKHAPPPTSLAWVCVAWRPQSSFELFALCMVLFYISRSHILHITKWLNVCIFAIRHDKHMPLWCDIKPLDWWLKYQWAVLWSVEAFALFLLKTLIMPARVIGCPMLWDYIAQHSHTGDFWSSLGHFNSVVQCQIKLELRCSTNGLRYPSHIPATLDMAIYVASKHFLWCHQSMEVNTLDPIEYVHGFVCVLVWMISWV